MMKATDTASPSFYSPVKFRIVVMFFHFGVHAQKQISNSDRTVLGFLPSFRLGTKQLFA